MSDFQFLLNILVQLFLGVVLIGVIRHKNSLISTLKEQINLSKSVLDLYDIQKFKDYQSLSDDVANLKHQKELNDAIKEAYNKSEELANKSIEQSAKDLGEKYNELLDFQLHFLLDLEKSKREEWLKLLPKNKEFIEQIVVQIKEGKIKSEK